MFLTRLSLQFRTTTLVLLGTLFVAGLSIYGALPRAEDPGFQIRVAVVTTLLPGANPEQVEMLVTDRLEEAVETMSEVDFISSESRPGVSVVEVNFGEQYANLVPIFDELREKVADARPELPPEAIGPFINDDFGDVFGTVLAITGEGFSVVELERAAERARQRLLRLSDVGKVDILGAQEERIFLEYDTARLAASGLGPAQLAQQLAARNILRPGGDVRTDQERFELEVSGNFESMDAVRRTLLRLPDGDLIALEDLVEVRRGTEEPAAVRTRYNGDEAVVLAVAMRDGGKITQLGPQVLDAVDALESEMPLGIEIHLASYQTTQVEKSVNNFVASLLQGIAVVLGVMLLTLGLRTGFIVAAMIPFTMVGSLVFMNLFGISLNQMSLAALIISLGLLVDSAIVMAESILVAIQRGVKAVTASLQAARELSLPLLVSSLTTAAALLPTYLAESTTGEYTSAIFEVVTISLLLAWVLSLTMTPLFCVMFAARRRQTEDRGAEQDDAAVSPGGDSDGDAVYDTRFYGWYRRRLEGLLQRPVIALLGFVILLGTSLWAFQFVPSALLPT